MIGTWGSEELAAAERCLRSGRVTMGGLTKEFEKAYAAYVGTRYAVACNSGSSANLLMVAAWTLRFGRGTVAVPAVGWATSYSPFQQYGWHLRFVDVDRETLNYDTDALREATGEVDLILAINLLGNPNEFDKFPAGVPILEDNCEAMGARYGGQMCGSFGAMASHSTYFSHHMCTIEGGLVTTDDPVFYDMLLSLRSHGWTRHLSTPNTLDAKVAPFHFILPGYNVRPTDLQCAIGLEQLRKLPEFVAQRRANAARFPFRTQREVGESSWFGMAVFGNDRDAFAGWETRPIVTGNFTRQPVCQFFSATIPSALKGADFVHDEGMMVHNSHLPIEWPSRKDVPNDFS